MTHQLYAIIADPDGKGYPFARSVFQEIEKKDNSFCLVHTRIQQFPDGEFKPIIEGNIRDKRCFYIHDSNKEPARWFTELCLTNSAIRDAHAGELTDVLPYMRFSRQDKKEKEAVRTPISIGVVGTMVSAYAHAMVTMDLHNDASLVAFDVPSENLSPFPVMAEYLKRNNLSMLENLVIASTDVGGGKRTSYAAEALGTRDVALSYKVRPAAGVVGSITILGDVAGRNVLFTDDIIDSGGTMAKAAQEARKRGAQHVYAYGTHALFTKGADHIAPYFDRIFVGDTLAPPVHQKVEVITYAPRFAEVVYRMAHGQSVKALA